MTKPTKHKPDCSLNTFGPGPICTCGADTPTPPASADAEVREAREAFTALIQLNKGNQAVSQTFICHAEAILAALDQAQGENSRFADMLENVVADWRKLYTEERFERVRIESILMNDVQAERQEADDHIRGLETVIDVKSTTIAQLRADLAAMTAENEMLKESGFICMYCRRLFPATVEGGNACLKHDRECKKNPLVADLAASREREGKLRAVLKIAQEWVEHTGFIPAKDCRGSLPRYGNYMRDALDAIKEASDAK